MDILSKRQKHRRQGGVILGYRMIDRYIGMWVGRMIDRYTVCPGSSYPSEKMFNIFASENEVYTIYRAK